MTPGSELRRGLTAKTLWAPAAGLVLAVACVFMLWAVVASGAYVALPEERLLNGPRDDWLHVSHATASARRSAGDRVVFLGGSGLREVLGNGEALEAQLEGVDVLPLASTAQGFDQSLVIVDNLPPATGSSVVFLGVNHWRFTYGQKTVRAQLEGQRLLLDSPALRAEAAREGIAAPLLPTSAYALRAHVRLYLLKQQPKLIGFSWPRETYAFARYGDLPRLTSEEKQGLVRTWVTTWEPRLHENVERNERLLRACVETARARGYTVVLLEQPLNREATGAAFSESQAAYRPRCAALARELSVSYLDVNGELDIPDGDFYDLVHVVTPEGQRKWNARLAAACRGAGSK